MQIRVSRHALQRLRERCGLNKKSAERLAQKAYEKGIRHGQTKGNLNKWVTAQHFKNENIDNLIIYGDNLYLFDGEILVTVFRVPNNLLKNLENMVKR